MACCAHYGGLTVTAISRECAEIHSKIAVALDALPRIEAAVASIPQLHHELQTTAADMRRMADTFYGEGGKDPSIPERLRSLEGAQAISGRFIWATVVAVIGCSVGYVFKMWGLSK